jgi:V/A-type H+-transporting ATPase subunit E
MPHAEEIEAPSAVFSRIPPTCDLDLRAANRYNQGKWRKAMSEDLQGLLEKINRDGVEKANAEAARILSDAKAKASAIVKEAAEAAAKEKADAEKAAADYAARAQTTISQAARDVIRNVEASVTALLERLLREDVDAALADGKTAAALAAEAVKGVAGQAEVAAPSALAAALKAQLASRGDIKIVTDDALGSGFSVRTDGGRVEHDFTGGAIAAELARRLRPDLAKLVKA